MSRLAAALGAAICEGNFHLPLASNLLDAKPVRLVRSLRHYPVTNFVSYRFDSL